MHRRQKNTGKSGCEGEGYLVEVGASGEVDDERKGTSYETYCYAGEKPTQKRQEKEDW